MGTTRTRPPPTLDLSRWIVNQSPRRQPEAGPSHFLSSLEGMHVEEEDKEPRPAGRGLKRKRDARKSKEGEEREEEREFEKREGETRKRNKPFRTGKFHNPKCERCETEGESCEKQKTGVACYQCATRRARCKPTGGKLRKPPIPTPTVVEKLALAPASRVAQQVEEDDPFGDIAAHRKKSTVRFADQATPSKKRERNWISSDAPKRTPKPPTPSPSPDPQPSSPKPAITVPQTSPQSTQTGFICDKQYYHESGDFAFVVEDTLFKIHRFQLERCSPSFADNLLLLGGPTVAENGAFFLQDKVDEFRALCWALYAPPQETALQYNASNFKLKLVLNLFLISHKYSLESLQTFATQLLVYHCTPPKTTCRTPELEDILRLAIRNGALPLTKVVEESLLRRLEDDQTISSARLITLAEELGMREFQGKLYYRELVREEGSFIPKIPSSTAYDFPCTNLTEKQSLALFRGYRSLGRYWQQLPGAVHGKKLPQLASCTKDHQKCESEWNSAWSVETIKNRDPFPPNFDILASLEKIQTSAPDAFVTSAPIIFGLPNTQPWMRQCGQKELSNLINQLKDTLADHFLGSRRLFLCL